MLLGLSLTLSCALSQPLVELVEVARCIIFSLMLCMDIITLFVLFGGDDPTKKPRPSKPHRKMS